MKAPHEFRLLPFGVVDASDAMIGGGVFTFRREHATQAVRWFAALGRMLSIDYEHQSLRPRPAGPVPAAGWIRGLEARPDGLWATGVEWTATAARMLESGEYRFASPVIYWTDEEHRGLISLGSPGLTNNPAIRGAAMLAASARQGGLMDGFVTVCAAQPLQFCFSGSNGAAHGCCVPSATLVARARGEWESDPALRVEFGDFGVYASFKAAEAEGRVSIAGRAADRPAVASSAARATPQVDSAAMSREWDSSAALRNEFCGSFEAFAAFRVASAAGLVTICGR